MLKIKNGEKVFKTMIYTFVVLNIISFIDVTKSQSKFKEEKENAVVYTAYLYNPNSVEIKEDTIIISSDSIRFMNTNADSNLGYAPNSKKYYFEYAITAPIINPNYTLDYTEIKNNMSVVWESTDKSIVNGTCEVKKYQETSTDKGIIECTTANDFTTSGMILKISASDRIEEKIDNKTIITNLTINGEKTIPVFSEGEPETDTITVSDIRFIDGSMSGDADYVPISTNVYFEYNIISEHILDYKNIEFTWNSVDNSEVGKCLMLKIPTDTDKGLVSCTTANDFGKLGIKLNIRGNNNVTKLDYVYYKKIPTNLAIREDATVSLISATKVQEAINKISLDKTQYITSSPKCETLIDWLYIYDTEYYAPKAKESYDANVGNTTSKERDFGIFDRNKIKNYVYKYTGGNDTSCSIINKNIPGITYREIEIVGDNYSKSRFVYKVEDNFIGYVKTFDAGNTIKKVMYFTTKDGRSFTTENDRKWQNIFKEYLTELYPTEKQQIIDYIDIKYPSNGIINILKVLGNNSFDGIIHQFKPGSIKITDILFDYIYNSQVENVGKEVRVTFSNSILDDVALRSELYKMYINNLDIVYSDRSKYSVETLASLKKIDLNATDIAKEIYNILTTNKELNITNKYSAVIQGLGSDAGKTFNVSIYSDDKYNYFEILPVSRETANYRLVNTNVDSLLNQVQLLDEQYGIVPRETLDNEITYITDERSRSIMPIGYVELKVVYDTDNKIKEVIYDAYLGEFDTDKIKPTNVVIPEEIPVEDKGKEELNTSEVKEEDATLTTDEIVLESNNSNMIQIDGAYCTGPTDINNTDESAEDKITTDTNESEDKLITDELVTGIVEEKAEEISANDKEVTTDEEQEEINLDNSYCTEPTEVPFSLDNTVVIDSLVESTETEKQS